MQTGAIVVCCRRAMAGARRCLAACSPRWQRSEVCKSSASWIPGDQTAATTSVATAMRSPFAGVAELELRLSCGTHLQALGSLQVAHLGNPLLGMARDAALDWHGRKQRLAHEPIGRFLRIPDRGDKDPALGRSCGVVELSLG